MTTVTIYFVRHGECTGNVEQKFLDPFSDILTATGRVQAELLGNHLSEVPFTQALCSSFPRARQTAEVILSANSKSGGALELQKDARIRERDYSGHIGVSAKDLLNILYKAMREGTSYPDVELENCETVARFEERIIRFFRDLIEHNREHKPAHEETILVVSHGLTIQRLFILLNKKPKLLGVDEWHASHICERQMRNTAFHKMVLEVGERVIGHMELTHCVDHLVNPVTNGNEEVKDVNDENNYTFLEHDKKSGFENDTVHYCQPV